jgi:hypothetical protein
MLSQQILSLLCLPFHHIGGGWLLRSAFKSGCAGSQAWRKDVLGRGVRSTMRLLFIHLGDAKHLEGILSIHSTSE